MKRAAQVTARDTQRVWLIRQRWSPVRACCAQCNGQGQLLTPAEAAAFARTDVPTINALMESGQLHWQETAEGARLICLKSLL
jgi:hypothetical protein